MKIFITGATGYIGGAAAAALKKSGHEIVGLTHSSERAKALKAAGVEPVSGDIKKPAEWRAAVDTCDVLIHAAFEYGPQAVAADETALTTLIESARAAKSPRLLIYTSGVWVLGGQSAPATELTPLNPLPIVAWRPAHEQTALAAAGGEVSAVVVRPGCVYGGRRGLYADMIESAVEKKTIKLTGDGSNCWANVFIDDLGELYRLILEKRPEREIYHATDGTAETVHSIATALASAAGGAAVETTPLEEARKKLGPLADALALDQRVSSDKARKDLGWKPAMISIAKNASALVKQWRPA